jgi:hypothetical protein
LGPQPAEAALASDRNFCAAASGVALPNRTSSELRLRMSSIWSAPLGGAVMGLSSLFTWSMKASVFWSTGGSLSLTAARTLALVGRPRSLSRSAAASGSLTMKSMNLAASAECSDFAEAV